MLKKLLKAIFYFFCTVSLISLATLIFYVYYKLNKPLVIQQAPIIIEIKPNSSASSLINTLYTQKLIDSKSFFLQFIKYKKLANRLKKGVYQVHPGESAVQLIYRIVAGDVLTLSFRIIEGTTQSVISTELTNALYLNYQSDDWKLITADYLNAEGLLLADTYQYDGGSDAKQLLQRANKNLFDYLNASWNTRSANLPYNNAYDMLIAASIVEKETALADERRIISGIIVNRLKKNMPLQMDPTVIYGLGVNYTGKLSHQNMSFVSPYNTYINRGLPPTPIAMVGKEAINAAAHPQFSRFLYFFAKGDGSHIFSATYNEQKKAIYKYKK